MIATIVMAVFGLMTGFSTIRVADNIPISSVSNSRLKSMAAGSLILLVMLIGLALVWSLMEQGVREWALSYILAYAAGMLAALRSRIDERSPTPVTGHIGRSWRQIRLVPKLFVAVLLLTVPFYFLISAFTPSGKTWFPLVWMAVFLAITIWLQRLLCPTCGRKFFGPGAWRYWSSRCAACGTRCP
jgi:hypothetical protein